MISWFCGLPVQQGKPYCEGPRWCRAPADERAARPPPAKLATDIRPTKGQTADLCLAFFVFVRAWKDFSLPRGRFCPVPVARRLRMKAHGFASDRRDLQIALGRAPSHHLKPVFSSKPRELAELHFQAGRRPLPRLMSRRLNAWCLSSLFDRLRAYIAL